jgi:hypothetical protein
MAQTRKSKQQIALERLKREIVPQLVGQEPRVPIMRGLDVRQNKATSLSAACTFQPIPTAIPKSIQHGS